MIPLRLLDVVMTLSETDVRKQTKKKKTRTTKTKKCILALQLYSKCERDLAVTRLSSVGCSALSRGSFVVTFCDEEKLSVSARWKGRYAYIHTQLSSLRNCLMITVEP